MASVRGGTRQHKMIDQDDGTQIETRECSKCDKWLPLSNFGKCKQDKVHGLNYLCKPCNNEKARLAREENKRKIEAGEYEPKESKPRPDARKTHTTRDGVEGKDCSKCTQWKTLEEFGKGGRHGKASRCLSCNRDADRARGGYSGTTGKTAKKPRVEINGVLHKDCYTCGIRKPFPEFSSDKSKADGTRNQCKDCDKKRDRGCKHGISNPSMCMDCMTIEHKTGRKDICQACFSTWLSKQRQRSEITYCAGCDANVPKRIELIVRPLLLGQINHPPSAIDDVFLGGKYCNSTKRRPDLMWVYSDRVICVEIDEKGGHPDRLPECELAKVWDTTDAAKKKMGEGVYVHFVRFNPDEYDLADVSIDDRITNIATRVNSLISTKIDPTTATVPHIEYHYYHSKAQFHVDHAKTRVNSIVLLDCTI